MQIEETHRLAGTRWLGLYLVAASVAVASAQTPPVRTPPQPSPLQAGSIQIVEQVLVRVNGDILTKTDLEARQVSALRQRGQQLSDEDLAKAIIEVTPQLLVSTIDEMLLVQRGRELGLRMTDERFAQILENIRKENKLESDEQFQAALKSEGMTLADLRRQIEIQMLIGQVQQQEVLGRISVSEAEARDYYRDHAKEFTTPATLTLREILVNVPTDGKTISVGLDEEAQSKAEAARARVVKGESFEKVAAEVSDSPSKANGGLIGPLDKDELAPALQDLVAKLKPGGVSEIIRTKAGYYFFRLETASETKVLPFDQARDRISDRVAAQKRGAEFEKYIRKLRQQAIIEWKNVELRKLYEQQVNRPPASPVGP